MRPIAVRPGWLLAGLVLAAAGVWVSARQKEGAPDIAPTPLRKEVDDFADVLKKMSAAKDGIMKRQQALLKERYDLADQPAKGVKMTRGKAVQGGARARL